MLSALRVFRFGAAYVPGQRLLYEIDQRAADLEALLEDDWIAW